MIEAERKKPRDVEAVERERAAALLARTPDHIDVYRKRRRYYIWSLIGWWIAIASFAVGYRYLDETTIVWAWLAGGIGVVTILLALILRRLQRPIVVVSAEGYLDRRIGTGLIPWDDVRFVSFGARGKRRIIRFIFHEKTAYAETYREPRRYRRKQQSSYHEGEMTLAFDNMTRDAREILAVIRKVSGKTGQFEGHYGVQI